MCSSDLVKGRFFTPNPESDAGVAPRDVFVVAEPAQVLVKAVPTEQRPATYTGAVGVFGFKASLSTPTCKVGEPVSLTLTLQGQGLLDVAAAPDLESMGALRNSFRVYPPTESTVGDERVFSYAVRPTQVMTPRPAPACAPGRSS